MSELSIDVMNASREAAITARAETLKEIIGYCSKKIECPNIGGEYYKGKDSAYSDVGEECRTLLIKLSL